MQMIELIEKKKQGLALSKEEIEFIIKGYTNGEIPDYQISAWLMSVYFQNMNQEEVFALTNAMLHSGEVVDLSAILGVKCDKHSTGGVGDKTSLVVAPIASALGVKMAKMSGRGLGHTGGTLDKLESIPHFKIELPIEQFYKQVNEIGLAIIGQTKNIVPADKLLYALRDVTGTVDSIPLIASSIMSKKLASGADHIVLDVKVGSGAFMKNEEEAKKLATLMVQIGKKANKKIVATITDMEQPLGCAIGNSLEVIEAIETLKGKGPKDFSLLCKEFVSEILLICGIAKNKEESYGLINRAFDEGLGLKQFEKMIIAQGGNPQVINDYGLLPLAKEKLEIRFKGSQPNYIKQVDALTIGEAAMLLGAGRQTKEDTIDLGVGIVLNKKVGDQVLPNELLATIYTNGRNNSLVIAKVMEAYQFSLEPVKVKPIIIESIS